MTYPMNKTNDDNEIGFEHELEDSLLEILLVDRSSGKNVIWATPDYSRRGDGFQWDDCMEVSAITGNNGEVIPRSQKTKREQADRIRHKAEVFTPSHICNSQNNLIDNAWFGRENVFNQEVDKGWITTEGRIEFPTGKCWQDYVGTTRLEITCGEAPYLVSPYDAVTGRKMEISKRIGFLDRKMRVISENVKDDGEWEKWTKIAFQSVYGFDWQGDNVLLARENLLYSYMEYYELQMKSKPDLDRLKKIAEIISWNVWQMDGLKYVIPENGNKNDPFRQRGICCMIKDWKKNKIIKFSSLLSVQHEGTEGDGRGDTRMKFDAVVGNPPYQENIGTAGVNDSLGKQLFPHFMKFSMELSPEYSSLIVPSRWYTGKAQDGSFLNLRKFLLSNNHFEKIANCLNGRAVFADVNTGSLMYYLHRPSHQGDVEFAEYQKDGSKTVMKRPLFEDGLDVVIPLNSTVGILQKVRKEGFVSMECMVTSRNPFGVPPTERELQSVTTLRGDEEHTIPILCAYEEIRFIPEKEITRNKELLRKWKVFTAKINGGAGTILDGKTAAILGKTFVKGPETACSNTLLAVGAFETQKEAENLNAYMKTKFFRFMLGIKKNANVLTRNVYSFVPLQDFTECSDIDWSLPGKEIDALLYEKYGLTKEESDYVEGAIRAME